MSDAVHNPRAEAATIARRPEVRVLEPSPPAVHEGPWFADDPAAVGDADPATVVTPTSAGDLTWSDLARTDASVAAFARARWLGNRKGLPDVPADYVDARLDYHRLAYAVVSNARKDANGKFGLRYTHLGFGTPYFGDDRQVRVEGVDLVVQHGDAATRTPITTLRAAAAAVGTAATDDQAEHDTVELGDLDRPLTVSEQSGAFLADWFGFATSVLEEVRLLGADGDDVSRVQIWPGHFDPAVEIGDADAGQRASYGASPGDADHDEPYLYVGAWGEVDRSNPFWNDTSFNGASMSYAELRATDDPWLAAVDFFGRGYSVLHGS